MLHIHCVLGYIVHAYNHMMLAYRLITGTMATEVPLSPISMVMADDDCSETIPKGLSFPKMVTVACVLSTNAAPPVALLSCTTNVYTEYTEQKAYYPYITYSLQPRLLCHNIWLVFKKKEA